MWKNVKLRIHAISSEIVFYSFLIFPPDESEVELVDYIENPEVKDGNLSYLTSVI